eukprot:TRINITY_DN70019_c0_g1_i1.p1 TRINITY_DN70019_c0_g1~~TRINITY_DN70019_c0_g1_i1.p1  ORF type:complete len:631 (-),score=59.38 TRINITY_DN70019_c0_g1_i1:151-2043(-)
MPRSSTTAMGLAHSLSALIVLVKVGSSATVAAGSPPVHSLSPAPTRVVAHAPGPKVAASTVNAQVSARSKHLAESVAFSTESTPRRLADSAAVLTSLEVLLSTQRRAPIAWSLAVLKYSLTVPSEAVAAALVAVVGPAFVEDTELTVYQSETGVRELLESGKASTFADVPTEEAARLILEVRHPTWVANYTVSVIRSTISSNYVFPFPDRAEEVPPRGTLTWLSVHDSFGSLVRLDPQAFSPQRSQYIATVNMEMSFVWLVASKNDPDPAAELHIRLDGSDWTLLIPGVNSPTFAVPERGWLLVEIKVSSPAAAASGHEALIYQVVVTREVICHERCRTCFGPGEEHCLTCRAPLLLFEGRCEITACPPNGYFEWGSYQCRRCDPSCAQCDGPGLTACTFCPALRFLAAEKWEDSTGECVISCRGGTFADPASRRCRQPPLAPVKAFYLSFLFRVAFLDFQYDQRLQRSILHTVAFVLGLSTSDVRSYQIVEDAGMLQITVEVVSPFLLRSDADHLLIDSWFGAFEVPVDAVKSMSWDELHPPLPALPVEPWAPSWLLGLVGSLISGVVVVVPMYCVYFRRLSNTRKRYTARIGGDPVFVDRIVHQSPAWLIRRFVAKDTGAKFYKGEEE